MTGYSPHQLLVALGKARRRAWTIKKTVHVVVNDGLTAWLTGPLKAVDRIEPHHTVVIRDIHPVPMSSEMIDAYCEAICHDHQRAGHIADALRRITKKDDGSPMETEEIAMMLWDMAEHIERADQARITKGMGSSLTGYSTLRRDLPGYQEPRA